MMSIDEGKAKVHYRFFGGCWVDPVDLIDCLSWNKVKEDAGWPQSQYTFEIERHGT